MKSSRRYDTVIFDLDGTLLDTLADLTDSTNAVLARYEHVQYTQDQVRRFVGNGILKLMQRAVPGGEQHPAFAQIHSEFRAYYNAHCTDRTKPYPGITALLEWLRKEEIQTAIVSNKADIAVKKLRDIYFGELVPVAIGDREGCRRKPAPDAVLQALAELGAETSRAVYVGDSDVDLETAQNAGLPCIAVSWGFRSREFLIEHGAQPDRIAANAEELKEMLSEKIV